MHSPRSVPGGLEGVRVDRLHAVRVDCLPASPFACLAADRRLCQADVARCTAKLPAADDARSAVVRETPLDLAVGTPDVSDLDEALLEARGIRPSVCQLDQLRAHLAHSRRDVEPFAQKAVGNKKLMQCVLKPSPTVEEGSYNKLLVVAYLEHLQPSLHRAVG